MSPEKEDTPSLISLRYPAEIETARIITRKEIAMDTIAIFPLKRSFPAMKREAFIDYQM